MRPTDPDDDDDDRRRRRRARRDPDDEYEEDDRPSRRGRRYRDPAEEDYADDYGRRRPPTGDGLGISAMIVGILSLFIDFATPFGACLCPFVIVGAILGLIGVRPGRAGAGPPTSGEASSDADEVAAVKRIAADRKLGTFSQARSEHFLAMGNAPAPFQREALSLCESMGQSFLAHFRGKGFTLDYPSRRLTLIVLKDRDSYGAFLGEEPGKDEGGHFDLETNRLVIFDFRLREIPGLDRCLGTRYESFTRLGPYELLRPRAGS